MAQSLSEIKVQNMKGQTESFNDYKGKVLLVVNVASKCGLTPQYDGLENLYKKYQEKGLVVMGFPANEFGAQEPGSNEEIQEFCRMNFGVQFPLFQKIVVKGEGQHPLYQFLTNKIPKATMKPDSKLKNALMSLISSGKNDVMWNFEKFLVNRQGEVVGRFAPDIAPEDPLLVQAIEGELSR